MRARNQFRPEAVDGLEPRLALHHGSSSISVVTTGLLGPNQGFSANQTPSITTLVNQSFASFEEDYTQSRSIYISAIQAHTAATADSSALNQYTQQRVILLGQQLLNNLFQASPHIQHEHGVTDPATIITKKIDGQPATLNKTNPFNYGTLGCALLQSTPSASASPTAISLDSLAQDNAIEAARVAMINGINAAMKQASKHH
jgi:hypothetical protein